MKWIFFTICCLGSFSCWSCFRDELKGGKLYPSLGVSAIGWGVGALLILILWRDDELQP